MDIIITLSDIIAIGLGCLFFIIYGCAWLYQKYWFLPRHTYSITKRKWLKNSKFGEN